MGRIALLAAAAALLVAAAPPATSGRAGWRITPDGLGPVRIGMSRAEVTRVVGAPLRGDEITEGCIEMQPARGWRGIYFMFEEGRLTRISMSGAESGIATPRGIRVGASEAEVRRAYGRGNGWRSGALPVRPVTPCTVYASSGFGSGVVPR